MIVDSSALVAILQQEAPADRLLQAIASSSCHISAATLLEVGIVADARSSAHGERLDRLIDVLEITAVPVSIRQAQVARLAYRRFGRGSGSPARLNFGDCFAYALAVELGEPLLFVGSDFSETDVAAARW
ncbi:type II toxin-antitoxin system VapC family toxin [Serinicoccus kebangsaanensis]|uniref:type II toxin-antitoxin system VapC family toxin n=1 Tax=Serinicoccus kebangsaanensis TaxID=2602069 RepID=UPI00124CC5E1|nr:type II toxin-antitoxin system VapC family toxin [Serinicoccus kebangsaanensis]